MTTRQVQQIFDQYQRAKIQFVQGIADLASRTQAIELLHEVNAIPNVTIQLRPLLSDNAEAVQHTAAIALGRLANNDEGIANTIIDANIIPDLVEAVGKRNRYFKKAVTFVLRSVAKHSPEHAESVVKYGALEALVLCLEEFDSGVKECASWAVVCIARHNSILAQDVVDAGIVPLLVLCLQEPEICLKFVAASAISEISKHSQELAQAMVDARTIYHLAKTVLNPDAKLKRQVLLALSNISKHSSELAELVVEAEVYPHVLNFLSDQDDMVKKNTAVLVRETVKHTPELSQMIVNAGGLAAITDYLMHVNKSGMRLPGIMVLGYIAAHSEQLAMVIIVSKGLVPLAISLSDKEEDHIIASAVWALGNIGRHSPDHSDAVAKANFLPAILKYYQNSGSSEDLKQKCKASLKMLLQKCVTLSALEPLLYEAPPNIIKYVLGQFSKVLPHDARARRLFVTSGGLKKVQEMKAEPGSLLKEYINIINQCFPEEVIRYYSPGYPEHLLERVNQYQPKLSPSLSATGGKFEESVETTDTEAASNLAESVKPNTTTDASGAEMETLGQIETEVSVTESKEKNTSIK